MAVNVKSCYLYLLDNVHQMFMPTERPLDETVDGAYHFLEKNIEKCMKNAAGRPAVFKEDSEARQLFLQYRNRTIPFMDFANAIATNAIARMTARTASANASAAVRKKPLWSQSKTILRVNFIMKNGLFCRTVHFFISFFS